MINIALLTSEEDIELTKSIINYFTNYIDAQVSCVISNKIENSEINFNFRRYLGLKNLYNINQYKEIDNILVETNSLYIIVSGYNEKIPPNFCKKYNWKIINLEKYDYGIKVFFVKQDFKDEDIIFKKDIFINKNVELSDIEKNQKVNDMSIKYYPILIEKIIRETFKKLYGKL